MTRHRVTWDAGARRDTASAAADAQSSRTSVRWYAAYSFASEKPAGIDDEGSLPGVEVEASFAAPRRRPSSLRIFATRSFARRSASAANDSVMLVGTGRSGAAAAKGCGRAGGEGTGGGGDGVEGVASPSETSSGTSSNSDADACGVSSGGVGEFAPARASRTSSTTGRASGDFGAVSWKETGVVAASAKVDCGSSASDWATRTDSSSGSSFGTTTHGSAFGGAAAAGASASSDELESSSSSSSSSLSSSVFESGGESGGLGMGFAPGLLAKRRLGLSGVCLRGGEGRSGSQLADAVRPAADAVPRGRELGAVAAGTGLGPGSVLDALTRCASFFPRVFCQPAPRSLVAAADPGCSLRMCATSARSVLKPALARLRLHPLTLHLCGLSTESLAPLGDADACASPRSSHVRRGRSSLGGAAGDVARLTTSKLPSALGVMRTPGPRGMPLPPSRPGTSIAPSRDAAPLLVPRAGLAPEPKLLPATTWRQHSRAAEDSTRIATSGRQDARAGDRHSPFSATLTRLYDPSVAATDPDPRNDVLPRRGAPARGRRRQEKHVGGGGG